MQHVQKRLLMDDFRRELRIVDLDLSPLLCAYGRQEWVRMAVVLKNVRERLVHGSRHARYAIRLCRARWREIFHASLGPAFAAGGECHPSISGISMISLACR